LLPCFSTQPVSFACLSFLSVLAVDACVSCVVPVALAPAAVFEPLWSGVIAPCELLGVVEEPVLLGLVEVLCAAAAPAIARLSKAERANFFMPSFLSVRWYGFSVWITAYPMSDASSVSRVCRPIGIPKCAGQTPIGLERAMDKREKKDSNTEKIEASNERHVVDDAQSPYNEGQQEPGDSGDPRMPRAVGVPLPWGGQTDDLHPADQPAGDVSDPSSERTPHRKEKKSA
jgi:hypothetical protein